MWDDALSILRSPAVPAWIVAVVIFTRAYRSWPDIMQRWNERRKAIAAEKDADWARLREEIKALRERLNEEVGRGERRQEQADKRHQEQEAENGRCQHELAVVRAQLQQEIAARIRAQRNRRGAKRNELQTHISAQRILDDLEGGDGEKR